MLQKFYLRTGAADHALCYAQLDAVLENQDDKLLVVLIGQGGTPPDAALAYIELLKQAPGEVAITSLANLIGADFALWLAASPLRDLRPNAWVFVPERFQQPNVGNDPIMTQTVEAMVSETAYQTCLEIIGEHVELSTILNRQVHPAELRELFLLDCACLDNLPGVKNGPPLPKRPDQGGPLREGGLL